LQVIKVDPKKCTGCHQCELWCGTEIASVAKELAGAIQERVWMRAPMEPCGGIRKRSWYMFTNRPVLPAGCV
jgi:Fe-S-cluster-containing dehydrogenase component